MNKKWKKKMKRNYRKGEERKLMKKGRVGGRKGKERSRRKREGK